jgi:hypothetical protein
MSARRSPGLQKCRRPPAWRWGENDDCLFVSRSGSGLEECRLPPQQIEGVLARLLVLSPVGCESRM